MDFDDRGKRDTERERERERGVMRECLFWGGCDKWRAVHLLALPLVGIYIREDR